MKLYGAGQVLSTISFELTKTQTSHFRKNTAIWDLMAVVGGFSVTLMFLGQVFYRLAKTNSTYVLISNYMSS